MRNLKIHLLLLGLMLVPGGGCQQDRFDASLPPTLEDVDRILNNDNLNSQEKRRRLEEIGLTPVLINALLRGDSDANQFGGDLRSAFDKVTGGRFTELTPDEVQIYTTGATGADTSFLVEFDDAQAAAVVAFFIAQDLDSEEELKDYLDDPANEVPGAINDSPAGVLRDVFVTFDSQKLIPFLP